MQNGILVEAGDYTRHAEYNFLHTAQAAQFGIYGLPLFDEPLVGFASAEDPLFIRMKETDVVGPQFMLPNQWLEDAKTVISFFFPFTEAVRKSNYANDTEPSAAWLFAQTEGQQFIYHAAKHIVQGLEAQGYLALIPSLDPRFQCVTIPDKHQERIWGKSTFTSNWSERHIAYLCGLGTFGLSKGLITEKGISGRLCSIVTNAEFSPTVRQYSGIYDYCSMCGACISRCPAGAISLSGGKNHAKCSLVALKTREAYFPRDGCGKCHVHVPCEYGIPEKIRK